MKQSTSMAIGGSPLLSLLLLGLTTHMVEAASREAAEVGVVADYQPMEQRFTFIRPPHGESVPVRIGMVVVAGDSVTLENATQSVTVQLAGGEVARFKGPGRFVVPNGRLLGSLAAVFDSLPELFNDRQGITGAAISRGVEECGMAGYQVPPITVPGLPPGSRVVAGQRDLLIAWHGGCPPFAVELRSGASSLARRDSIDEWQVSLDGLELAIGRHTVLVADATGRHWEGALEAVAQRPAIPADVAADSSNLGRNAQAICIARLDEGRWRQEGIAWLRPLMRGSDPLAVAIGNGLLWGSTAR